MDILKNITYMLRMTMLLYYGRPIGGSLYFCPVISIYLSLFLLIFFPRLVSAVGDWMSTITCTHGVALVRI